MNTKIENIINWIERINNMRNITGQSFISLSLVPSVSQTRFCIEVVKNDECLLEEVIQHNNSCSGCYEKVLIDLESRAKAKILDRKNVIENELKLLEAILNNNNP